MWKKWFAAFADDSLDINIYSRFSNPTVDEFIAACCALEGQAMGSHTGNRYGRDLFNLHDLSLSRRPYRPAFSGIRIHAYDLSSQMGHRTFLF